MNNGLVDRDLCRLATLVQVGSWLVNPGTNSRTRPFDTESLKNRDCIRTRPFRQMHLNTESAETPVLLCHTRYVELVETAPEACVFGYNSV